jgi:predicted ATP-dependent protease
MVSDIHVKRALADRKYRANMIEEKFQEMLLRDKIMIDTQDTVIGQVNGLSVIQTEEYAFGHPTRITARTYIGSNGVTNIERETKMSGSSHSKGVLTLAGFLGGQFAQEKPLAVNAQLTFEQNYGGVDGDSASSAELYALLSSLADVPLKQNIAVTGSINQKGEIQPIGGATEKIESFFDLCEAKGLTGEQGVIIPNQNVDDLMLKEEIIKAVNAAKFHIYSVKTVAEGIELLTGMDCGKRESDGNFTEGSVFRKVQQKLEKYNKSIEDTQAASGRYGNSSSDEYDLE